MIHYSCDLCKRDLIDGQTRYVVQIDVARVFEPFGNDESDDDRDYLEEVSELLESVVDDSSSAEADDAGEHMRFDLCADCHKRFVKNPLGHDATAQLDFSKN